MIHVKLVVRNDREQLVCHKIYLSNNILAENFKNSEIEDVSLESLIQSIDDGLVFLVGDNPDPTASEDSHNFGPVNTNLVIGIINHSEPVAQSGGPDGVRTRDRWIKSPSLYLTKLQAHPTVLQPVFNH